MKLFTSIGAIALSYCVAGYVMGAGEHSTHMHQPDKMDHSKMDHSKMDHSKMDHSKMDHSKMDHSKMDHSKMDHSKIPVSDGSTNEVIPLPFPGALHMQDDPILSKWTFDQLEVRFSDKEEHDPLVLEAEGWVGKDLDKLWLKTGLEALDGELEEAELQILYSRAISPYWDIQAGIRHDFEPVEKNWVALSLKGLSPYYFDVDTSLFISEDGDSALRLEGEYELMLSQKTALVPEIELNFYGQNDKETGTGSGLADMELGLRLQYAFKREFAPYLGFNWTKKTGNTADFAREEGETTEDTQFVIGIHAWF